MSDKIKFESRVEIEAVLNVDVPAEADKPLPSEIVWMPAGKHGIVASTTDGQGFRGEIICDEQACRAICASFDKRTADGRRIWLDFNHADGEASAWVKAFRWDSTKGIMAQLEWSAKGEAALRGKSYYSFSPAFAADPKTGRVLGLLSPKHSAGGLVNAPAFSAIPALIAARMDGEEVSAQPTAGGSPVNSETTSNMDTVTAPAAAATAAAAPVSPAPAPVQASVPAAPNPDIVAIKAVNDALRAQFTEVQAQLAAIKAVTGSIQVKASVEDELRAFALEQDPAARGSFYKHNIAPIIAKFGGGDFTREYVKVFAHLAKHAEIKANTLGTLTGNLIAQQALALAKYEYPILSLISTDFSSAAAKFNQTIDTRLKSALSASQYTSSYTAAAATTTDVPVQLSHHPYCQVAFNANEIAGTNRDLFGEQAEVVLYAVISDMVDALYALITSANFTTTVLKLASGTDGTTYTRADAIKAARGLFKNKMPRKPRFNLLNAEAFGALGSDSAVVSLAAYQKPEIITGYELPDIAGMKTIQAVNLPFTGGMVGFAAHPRALAIAARPVNDYTQAVPGVVPGAISQVQDPDTGITVTVTQFVDHAAGAANYRVALMYGVAKGDPLAGIITEEAAGS